MIIEPYVAASFRPDDVQCWIRDLDGSWHWFRKMPIARTRYERLMDDKFDEITALWLKAFSV